MNISEKNSHDYSSDESSYDERKEVACPSTGKRSYEDHEDYPDKRHRNEEPELDEPSTSGLSSTSYNNESSTKNKILHRLSHQDDSSSDESNIEESSDEGFELTKPSTSGLKSKTYNVESSAPKKTLHGLVYQLRLLMLFVQRVPDKQEFYLSTEMHEAGLFDDIVLQYLEDGIWRYRFLQAKHKNDDKYKIEINDLFNKKPNSKQKSQLSRNKGKKSQSSKNTGEAKPYLLKKYFNSYCNIKQDIEFRNANLEEFLICTNVGFTEEAMAYFECAAENDDDPILLNFEELNEKDSNPVKYRLRKKNISILKEEFEINSKNEKCFLNFIEKFRFLVNYEDDELNENIQNCLKKCLKIENIKLADAYLQKRVLQWFESYKDKKSKYLHIKDKKEFLKLLNSNIESLLVAGYSTFYFEELKSCGVKFKNILPLHEFLKHKKEKIMFIITATPKLSIIKLGHLFDKLKLKQDELILTDEDKLRINKKISTIFFAESSYKWLVIEYHHNEIKISRKMLNKILKMDNEKTVVMIGNEENILNFSKCLRLKTVCFYDKNNLFKDLTMVSQEKILERSIIFQGEKTYLNELINIYSARNFIDELMLEKLITGTITIGNNHAFQSDFLIEDCYIGRMIIQRELKFEILQNEEVLKNCLFIISDVNEDQLKDLHINNKYIFLWKDGKTFNNGIILSTTIESKDIFNKLCKNDIKNVCWLEYMKGKFVIRNISNDTDILHKYIICLEENDLNKKQILEKKIIILADGPGCGKSIFMTRVARQLKQIMSNIWILRINLSSYAYKQKGQKQIVKFLKDILFKNNETNRAIEFMADLLFPQKYKNENEHFVRELFTQSLDPLSENTKFPAIIFLFDGFDEISPTFKDKTLTLLRTLRNSNVAQMWVTTRNHEELSLEVALHSSSFFFKPLHDNDKINFLTNLWKYNFTNFNNIQPKPDNEGVVTYLREITNNVCNCNDYLIQLTFLDLKEHLLSFANHSNLPHFLKTFDFLFIAKRLIYYFADKMSEFTSNPLLLKMIAEITVFKKFSSLGQMDIFSLYEEFIKYKWTVFRDDKDAAGESVAGRNSFKIYLEYLTTYHQEIAFKSLFRPNDNKQVREESDKMELSRAGLLVIHEDRLEFVHRSFAEYFVSQYFAKYLKRKKIQKIVFSKVLVREKYSIIRTFLNSNTTFLEKLSSKTPQMIEIIRINNSNSRILYLLLEENMYNLFVKYLENLPVDFSKNALFFDEKTILHIICQNIKNEQILKNTLKAIKDSVSSETLIELFLKRDNSQCTALQCINFYNNSIAKQILQFFKLNCPSKLFYDLLLQVNETESTLLHIACIYGVDITYLFEVTSENRDAISKILLKTDNDGATALYYTMFSSNKPSLVTTLLHLIKSVCNSEEIKYLLTIKNDSLNLLHTACRQEEKGILVNFLNSIKDMEGMFETLVLDTDKDELTPLHYTVLDCSDIDMPKTLLDFVKLNCSTETLHTLLCKRSRSGTTMLHKAVTNFKVTDSHDSLIPLLTYLFNLVEDNKEIFEELLLTSDNKERTVLHYTFPQLIYPFLLTDLLDFVQANCSANILNDLLLKLDNNKASILHCVCCQVYEIHLTYLLNKIKDKSEILNKLLLQTDNKGQTALHYTVLKFSSSSMMRSLLNFVKINCDEEIFKSLLCKADNNGLNVLHIACIRIESKGEYKENLLSVLKFIENDETILNQVLLKTCNIYGCTPLHYTVRYFDNPSLLKILFDFIKIYAQKISNTLLLKESNTGCSLLHFACGHTNEESLKYLLYEIQDKNRDELILKVDHNGQNILHYSVSKFQMLKFLLDFVKSNCREEIFTKLILKYDNDERTALHIFCITSDNEEILTYLLNLVKDNTTSTIFNTFLSKRDNYGKDASDYIERNANHSALLRVLLSFSYGK